jgi:hypothetical protein
MGDVVEICGIVCDVAFSSFIDWICYANRDKKLSAELRAARKGSGVAHG